MKLNGIALVGVLGFGILAASFLNMSPRLESANPETRLKVIRNVSDQTVLGRVAMNDDDENVRVAAIRNLTDQNILLRVVLTDQGDVDHIDLTDIRKAAVEKLSAERDLSSVATSNAPADVRRAAIKRITDQDILGATLLAISDDDVRLAGIESIVDRELLVSVALSDRSEDIRRAVFERLTERSTLLDVELTANNDISRKNAELMSKVLGVYDALPAEHRDRLIDPILTIAHAFPYPSISSETEIVSIQSKWTPYSAEYSVGWDAQTGRLKTQTRQGEQFTIEIVVHSAFGTSTYTDTWKTYFHTDTDTLTFEPARVLFGTLINNAYQDIYKNLSQVSLSEIALYSEGGHYESIPGVTAASLLTDQDLLLGVASSALDDNIRRMAVARINDQNALSFFARTDDTMAVRSQAASMLTDLETLTRIALTDRALSVRNGATESLSAQGALQRVPPTNTAQDDRLVWIERLTDQHLLAIVALEATEVEHRMAAVRLLTDRAALSKIVASDESETVRSLAAARLGR